jgi:hypothetical protein
VRASSAASTTRLFLLDLVGLHIFGRSGSSKTDGGDAKSLLKSRVAIWRTSVLFLVGTVSPPKGLSSNSSQGRTSENLSAAVLRQIAVLVATTREQSSNTSAGKGTGSHDALAMRAFATFLPDNSSVLDIVVFVVTVAVVMTAVVVHPR